MTDHGLASNPWHVNGYNPAKVTHYPHRLFCLAGAGG